MLAGTFSMIGRLGRMLALCSALGLAAIAPASAQPVVPSGTIEILQFGANAEIHFESTASDRRVMGYFVFTSGQCKTDLATRLETAMCEILDKDGPQVRRVQFDLMPPVLGGWAVQFSGMLDFAGQEWPVRLGLDRETWRFTHIDSSVPGSPVLAVSNTRQKRAGADFSATGLSGNWQADFGSMRLEANLAANGARALEGRLVVHPSQSVQLDPPGSGSSLWPEWLTVLDKVAVDSGPVVLNYRAQATSSGLFTGQAVSMPPVEQNGSLRLISAGADHLIAAVSGDFAPDAAQPFLFSRMTGSPTPIASGSSMLLADLDGAWSTKTAVAVREGSTSGSGLWADLAISDNGTRLELTMGSGDPQVVPLTVWQRGNTGGWVVQHAGHVSGPNGKTIADWVGEAPTFATARLPGTVAGSVMLLVNGNRAVMLTDAPGGNVYMDIVTYANFKEAEVYFLERSDGDPEAATGGLWQGTWDMPSMRLALLQDGARVIGRLDNWSGWGADAHVEGRVSNTGRTLRVVLAQHNGEIRFGEFLLNGDNMGFGADLGMRFNDLDTLSSGEKSSDAALSLFPEFSYLPEAWNGTPPPEVAAWLAFETYRPEHVSQLPFSDARPTGTQTGIEITGLWTLDATGMVFDIVVEPAPSANRFPIYVVASRPANGRVNCGVDIGTVIERLCEIVDKDGPVLLWGEVSRVDAGHLNNTVPATGAQFSSHLTSDPFGDAGVQVGFSLMPGDPHGTMTLANYAASTGPTQTVRLPVRKLEDKFTPESDWASGNWRTDFRGMSAEAAFSASGPTALDGTVQFVPGTGASDIWSAKLSNFSKVVEDFGPFHMPLAAELEQAGSFFAGSAETDNTAYPSIYQNAQFWLLPLENEVMIVKVDDYEGSPDAPFLMQRSGPITPLAPGPSGESSGTSLVGYGHVGDWAIRRSAVVSIEGELAATDMPGIVSITSPQVGLVLVDGAAGSGEMDPLSDYEPDNRDFHSDIATRFGTLGGQSATQWLGGGSHWYVGSSSDTGIYGFSYLMLAGDDRAVLIKAQWDWMQAGVAEDYRQRDPQHPDPVASRIYYLERVGGQRLDTDGNPVVGTGSNGAGGGSSGPVGQLSTPPSLPTTGAAGLVWGADTSDPCTTLMKLEDALWAGAADGSVALDDLRVLTQLIYAMGVRNTGMVNEAECRSMLVTLQAEMAQRAEK